MERMRGMIESRARDLGVSETDLAAAYLRQQLAASLADAPQTKDFLLCSVHAVGMEAVRSETKSRLIYRIPARDAAADKLSLRLKHALQWQNGQTVSWTWRSEKQGEEFVFEMAGSIGEIRLPLELRLRPRLDMPTAKTYQMRLLMQNAQYKDIFIYNRDDTIAERSWEVMSSLMFLKDIGIYLELYFLLGECDIIGADMCRRLLMLAETEGVLIDAERLNTLAALQKDGFMKRTWKAYARRSGHGELAWEQVFDRFYTFIAPIWTALAKNEFWLDDWMGELERYI